MATGMLGAMVRANLDKQTSQVSAMFDQVADGYDRTRARLWWGRMDAWGREMAAAAGAGPGKRVLDVAAGTGTSTAALAATGARAVASDFSLGMLGVAGRRHPGMPRIAADALALPFARGAFDAVTISFGLRNIADPTAALREMRAVTRPGGRLVVCEFSIPPKPLNGALFTAYLRHVIPLIARRVSTNPEAYQYLAESIQAWHTPPRLGEQLTAAGWTRVAWRPLSGGVVHLHVGTAPAAE
ncbi:ubiquinone/menaquinone biosynthesis methyltransferase [Crossiella cryophila]|uniref:Demethylmenaquinone methyltransferase n=1 Tax=Crossiella cryophila TaxID=43355 RepID=A0A7W7FTX2_9PSEU|nr:ubiquinone/menaquinone biosynthesis methyltransferase [Crossiella cryophila]MBB4677465.1 demethylmenaquinone methyltransferase/2-methoxy-6-polyprenyl-1,4-benzoquinol methylase [Crossiella cryophila]